MESPMIQPSYQSFCRLTQNDGSGDFLFFINFEQGQTKHHIEIKTTLNIARVISQKVNTFYQTDPTIQCIEINIPFHLNCLEDEAQIKERIEKIFNSIIKSTNTPITVAEKDLFLLTLLLRSIEYNEKDKSSNSFELTKYISTISEAVSLLSTSFHIDAVQFLSEHLIEFLKSDMFQQIDEKIILDIIDFYVLKSNEKSKSEKANEYKQVFDIFKDSNETLFLMHLLLQIDESSLNKDMTNYIVDNIDDEIASKETPVFAEIAKKHFQKEAKKFNSFQFGYTGSLQTLKIPEDGDYEIEATGAAGSGGNTYGTSYTSKGGNGAKLVASFAFNKGDVIDVVVGGMGTSKQATEGDGASGGGGGGTFIFKRIDSITDERYQFTKGDIKYEALLAVAGGSGGEDSGEQGHSSVGHKGEASNYKSLNNFTEYSKTTNNCQSSSEVTSIMGISQFIQYDAKGSFYERANGFSRGGYGCGASADDVFSPGGGWCQGSNSYQATSWSLDPNAVGTDGCNEDNGSVTIKFKE